MKSWALAIVFIFASAFSPAIGEERAEAPKVAVGQQQKGLLSFSMALGTRSIVTPTFGA
jgi:hypothetical protein